MCIFRRSKLIATLEVPEHEPIVAYREMAIDMGSRGSGSVALCSPQMGNRWRTKDGYPSLSSADRGRRRKPSLSGVGIYAYKSKRAILPINQRVVVKVELWGTVLKFQGVKNSWSGSVPPGYMAEHARIVEVFDIQPDAVGWFPYWKDSMRTKEKRALGKAQRGLKERYPKLKLPSLYSIGVRSSP